MDRIRFKIPRFPRYPTIGIEINGRNFIDLVREVEKPFASRMAGAYQGIPAWQNFEAVRYFLAEEEGFVDEDGKLAVLGCTCGVIECWPLLARISVAGETVSWSDFEQPHRGERSPEGHWKYEALGPFTFDRQEYGQALAELDADLAKVLTKRRG